MPGRSIPPFAVVGWAGLVLFASVVPLPDGPTTPAFPLDAVAHAVGYGVLAALGVRAWPSDGASVDRRTLLVVGVAVVGYGAGVELLQWVVPTRSASLVDLAANAVGVAVALGLVARRRAGER